MDLFHDEVLELDFGFLFVGRLIGFGLGGQVVVVLVVFVVDLVAFLDGLFRSEVLGVVLHCSAVIFFISKLLLLNSNKVRLSFINSILIFSLYSLVKYF